MESLKSWTCRPGRVVDLREAPVALPSSEANAAPATTTPKQLPSTQTLLPLPKASKGPGKAGDQGQGVKVAKGKEAKALLEAKGSKADQGKEAAPKTKGSELVKPQVMPQYKKASLGKVADPPVSQPASQPVKKTLLHLPLFMLYLSFVQ
nr:hypothetical protein CFP56_60788 [Quercus suber]